MKTAVIGLGIAVLAYLVLVPLVLLIQQAAAGGQASAPADRVQLAWRLATEHAGGAGVSLPVYLTLNETAERLAVAMPTTAGGSGMAQTMERIAYAEEAPTDDEVVGGGKARPR